MFLSDAFPNMQAFRKFVDAYAFLENCSSHTKWVKSKNKISSLKVVTQSFEPQTYGLRMRGIQSYPTRWKIGRYLGKRF